MFQHHMLVDGDKKSGVLGLRKDPQPAPLVDERAGVLPGDRDRVGSKVRAHQVETKP